MSEAAKFDVSFNGQGLIRDINLLFQSNRTLDKNHQKSAKARSARASGLKEKQEDERISRNNPIKTHQTNQNKGKRILWIPRNK